MEQVLYQLPDGWIWRKLSELAKTTSGGTPSRSNKDYWGGSIPWVKSGELGDSRVEKNEEFITELGLKNSSAKLFPKESLLLALYGATAGKLGVLTYDAATNQAVCCISQDDQLLARDFLRYYLLSQRKKIIEDSFGGAQPNISQAYVREIDIPTPPLTEQKRIVEKLDALLTRIDTAIEHLQESVTLADSLYASELNEIFNPKSLPINQSGIYELPHGWEWKRIEDVFTITSGKNLTKKDMHVEGKFSVYGGNGIAGRYNDFNLSGSNIIIGRVGALCGNVRLVHGDIWVTDNAFFIKEYKVDILKEYLERVLSALNLGETANKAAQPVISYKGIKDLVIPYPPLDEQQRIVEKINNIGKLQVALKKQLQFKTSSLGQLKASILDSAFKGKL